MHQATSTSMVLTNAIAVLANDIVENATIVVENGHIAEVLTGEQASFTDTAHVYDARGAYVLPGVVDLHNDNLEHEINPRAFAGMPLPFALANMERRLASSGVTTEFHAISFQDNVAKGRSINDARAKAAFLQEVDDDPLHGVRHHILHRLDVRTPDSIDQAMPTLLGASHPYASLNDHSPGQGQYRDVERLIKIAHQHAEQHNGVRKDAEWYMERMRRAQADLETVPAFYGRVGALMASTDLVLSTHDDDTIEKVEEQLMLGAKVAEFPVTIEAAEFSRGKGMAIVVGAPNIVRGGSQSGNLNASDLVQRGLADIICADYHSPSLLPAAWRLVRDGLVDLVTAVRMVTLNPASAVGMTDRGEIAPGKLGDLAVVRLDASGWPHCEATIVNGRLTYHFDRSLTRPVARPSLVAS